MSTELHCTQEDADIASCFATLLGLPILLLSVDICTHGYHLHFFEVADMHIVA